MNLIPSNNKLTDLSGLNTKVGGLGNLNSGKSLSNFLNKTKHKVKVYNASGGEQTYELPAQKVEGTKVELGYLVTDFLRTMIGGQPTPANIFGIGADKLSSLADEQDYRLNVNSARSQGKRYISYHIAILDTTLNPIKDENGSPIGEMINEVVIAGLTSTSNWMIDVVANFNLKVDPYTISSIHMVPKSTTQAR